MIENIFQKICFQILCASIMMHCENLHPCLTFSMLYPLTSHDIYDISSNMCTQIYHTIWDTSLDNPCLIRWHILLNVTPIDISHIASIDTSLIIFIDMCHDVHFQIYNILLHMLICLCNLTNELGVHSNISWCCVTHAWNRSHRFTEKRATPSVPTQSCHIPKLYRDNSQIQLS